jgi:hypothetical protein
MAGVIDSGHFYARASEFLFSVRKTIHSAVEFGREMNRDAPEDFKQPGC